MKRDKISIIVNHGRAGVPADSFAKIIERTIEMVHGLDAKLTSGSGEREWTISKISINSPLHLEMTSPKQEGSIATSRALAGDLGRLQRGDRPRYMDDSIRASAIDMMTVIGDEIISVEFKGEGASTVTSAPLPAPIEESISMSASYAEVGSIEGTLEIAGIHGGDHIKVYDVRFGNPVGCAVSPRQFEEALAYLKRRSRVAVRGVIKFSGSRPKEVTEVFDIRELPGPNDRISINSIRPIDLMGDKDPADYLRGAG